MSDSAITMTCSTGCGSWGSRQRLAPLAVGSGRLPGEVRRRGTAVELLESRASPRSRRCPGGWGGGARYPGICPGSRGPIILIRVRPQPLPARPGPGRARSKPSAHCRPIMAGFPRCGFRPAWGRLTRSRGACGHRPPRPGGAGGPPSPARADRPWRAPVRSAAGGCPFSPPPSPQK